VLLNAAGEQVPLDERIAFAPLKLVGTHQQPCVFQNATATSVMPLVGVTPVEVSYFNLSGQRITKPQSGCYIQRTTYANGYVQTRKMLK
jgi:hypothetical protein